ncbi:DNA recombination protein RmuC, partial [Winogradskyella sp.]|nr:DNA recombination protein RmuC [Winogradskyella sp.]
MNDTLILFIAIITSAGIGAYIGLKFSQLKSKSDKSTLEERNTNIQQQLIEFKQFSEAENQKQSLNFNQQLSELKETVVKVENEREIIRREKDFFNTELSRRNTEFKNLQQLSLKRDEELVLQQEQLRKDFELMATKILDEKSEKFTLQNKENIKQILNPLQEKIQLFEKKVDDTQKESISMHSALKEQLLGLKDLNQQMA